MVNSFGAGGWHLLFNQRHKHVRSSFGHTVWCAQPLFSWETQTRISGTVAPLSFETAPVFLNNSPEPKRNSFTSAKQMIQFDNHKLHEHTLTHRRRSSAPKRIPEPMETVVSEKCASQALHKVGYFWSLEDIRITKPLYHNHFDI